MHKKRQISPEAKSILQEFVHSDAHPLVISEIEAIIRKQEGNLLGFRLGIDNERELVHQKLSLQGAHHLLSSLKVRLESYRLASSSAQKKTTP